MQLMRILVPMLLLTSKWKSHQETLKKRLNHLPRLEKLDLSGKHIAAQVHIYIHFVHMHDTCHTCGVYIKNKKYVEWTSILHWPLHNGPFIIINLYFRIVHQIFFLLDDTRSNYKITCFLDYLSIMILQFKTITLSLT